MLSPVRKALAFNWDWERLNHEGMVPPPPWSANQLDMFFDPLPILKEVKQPVLVIYGDKDTLAPPREGAATWTQLLKDAGRSDYHIQVFPNATHGLYVAQETGVALEVIRDPRYVPGYVDTELAWIRDHTSDSPTPQTVRADIGSGPTVEARGLHHVNWFGEAPVQLVAMVGSLVVFGSVLLAWPIAWMIALARSKTRTTNVVRWARLTGWILSAINVGVLIGMIVVVKGLADEEVPAAMYQGIPISWWSLSALSYLAVLLGVAAIAFAFLAWKRRSWSIAGRVHYTLMSAAAILWIPFLWYWELLRVG